MNIPQFSHFHISLLSIATMQATDSKKTCPECNRTFAHDRSLATHKSTYHPKPKVAEEIPPSDIEIDDPASDEISEAESSEGEDLKIDLDSPKVKVENGVDSCKRSSNQRGKNSLGKLSYQLDPSFDLMDAYEVKNLFTKLKQDTSKSARPFTGRYSLFIDAIVELNSLTEVCSLLNSRAIMLKNIFKRLEQRSSVWSARIKSFRLNANY